MSLRGLNHAVRISSGSPALRLSALTEIRGADLLPTKGIVNVLEGS
jgi:hypothetical protein